MAVGRAERRKERTPQFLATFGPDLAPVALDLLDVTELAWHDCYGEVSPPQGVVDDMLTVSGATIDGLVKAALLAVTDSRDLRLTAESLCRQQSSRP